jgi:hypothetical protein
MPFGTQTACSCHGSSLTDKGSNHLVTRTTAKLITLSVTSRAIVRLTEMKQQNHNRDAAQAAPTKVVAHL